MAKNKKNMGKSKIYTDLNSIKDELKILGMDDLVSKINICNEYILIEKLITFADIPCFGKYCYSTSDKEEKKAFCKANIEKRVKENKLFYSTINEMYQYEKSNKKNKLFYVQTKQANIALPIQFYKFINKGYPNGKSKYTFSEKDGYNFYLVNNSLNKYFNKKKTNECLEMLGKKQIGKELTNESDNYIKIQLSVGDHGVGTKKDEVFHNLRANIFARDKIVLLVEKTKKSPKKYNCYIMFFRNPKFFSLLGIGAEAYCSKLFNDNMDSNEESRKGQAKWRDMLAELEMALKDDDKVVCPITNIVINYATEGTLLRASHIKEYSKCKDKNGRINPNEAYDVNNGLLITADADALFDKHLITINPADGIIIFSKNISSDLKSQLKFSKKIDSSFLTKERKKYLQFHYNSFNELEKNRS